MQGCSRLPTGSADLRANCQGTGFVVTVGSDHRNIMELSAPIGGPVASLCSEAVGLLSKLLKVAERYNAYVQLMIFIDFLALLMILSKWGQSDFWPDPRDVIHVNVIFPLLKKLRGWSQKVTLIKVKRHAGCLLNEMADERAEKGRLSEAVPIYPGPKLPQPNKHGAFQLRIKASLRAQVAEDKLIVPLPHDEAPNKQNLRQAICANLILALKLQNTIFTQDVLVQQHGAVVCSFTLSY